MLQCAVGIGPCLAPTNLSTADFLPLTSRCFFCITYHSHIFSDARLISPTCITSVTSPYACLASSPITRLANNTELASHPRFSRGLSPHISTTPPKSSDRKKSTLYFARQRVHRTRLQAFRRLATRTTSFSVFTLSSGAWRTRTELDWQA
jgi:hypothetical protein